MDLTEIPSLADRQANSKMRWRAKNSKANFEKEACNLLPQQKRLKAFSLAELVFVLGIIAILYMLVMPNQASTVAMAKSIEAKSMLNQVYSLERNYFFMYSKYSTSLEEIGFEQERLSTEGGQANYRIEIVEASSNTFMANAVAVNDFDGDGEINVWQIDHDKALKEVTKD